MNGEKEYIDDRVGVEGAPIGIYGYHHPHRMHTHHPHTHHNHNYSDYWRGNAGEDTGAQPITVQVPQQQMTMQLPSHPLTVQVPTTQQPMIIKQTPVVTTMQPQYQQYQQPQYYRPYHRRWNTGYGVDTIAMPTTLTAYNNENTSTRHSRGTRRLINPFYWMIRVMDHGRRNHCIRRGNLPGSACARVVANVPVEPEMLRRQAVYSGGYEAPQYVPMGYAQVVQNVPALTW